MGVAFTFWLGAAAAAFALVAPARAASPDEGESQIIEEASREEGVETITGTERRPVQAFQNEEGVIELTNRSAEESSAFGAEARRARRARATGNTTRDPASSSDGVTSNGQRPAGSKRVSSTQSAATGTNDNTGWMVAAVLLGLVAVLGLTLLAVRQRAGRRLSRSGPWAPAAAVDEPATALTATLLRPSVPPPLSNRQWLSQRPPSDADSAEGSAEGLGQVEHYRPLPR
jgi:hypothetical protein